METQPLLGHAIQSSFCGAQQKSNPQALVSCTGESLKAQGEWGWGLRGVATVTASVLIRWTSLGASRQLLKARVELEVPCASEAQPAFVPMCQREAGEFWEWELFAYLFPHILHLPSSPCCLLDSAGPSVLEANTAQPELSACCCLLPEAFVGSGQAGAQRGKGRGERFLTPARGTPVVWVNCGDREMCRALP